MPQEPATRPLAVLSDPAYTVPSPGAAGPFGTVAWLRATVSRFAEGAVHTRRRTLVEARLGALAPAALRVAAAAHDLADREYVPVAVLAEATGVTGDVVEDV